MSSVLAFSDKLFSNYFIIVLTKPDSEGIIIIIPGFFSE